MLADGEEREVIQMHGAGGGAEPDEAKDGAEGGEPRREEGNILRTRRKPIRMLDVDGSIHEVDNNIVLPEGWGSDSDSDE